MIESQVQEQVLKNNTEVSEQTTNVMLLLLLRFCASFSLQTLKSMINIWPHLKLFWWLKESFSPIQFAVVSLIHAFNSCISMIIEQKDFCVDVNILNKTCHNKLYKYF